MNEGSKHQLIVAITAEGEASKLMEAAKEAGAEGGTILRGRGTGIHESSRFLGVPIEPGKDILLVLIERERMEGVLEAVLRAGELGTPGRGIAFVLDVPRVAGIMRLEEPAD